MPNDFETVRHFLETGRLAGIVTKEDFAALDRIEAEVEWLRKKHRQSSPVLDEVGNPIRLGGEEA